MAVPMIVFRNLPGIGRLESDQMIAEKFHELIPQDQINEVSRSLFGITVFEVQFSPPEWFSEGYDSPEEWRAAANDDADAKNQDEEEFFDEVDESEEQESPQREEVYRQQDEFYARLAIEDEDDLDNDYDLMKYARGFGFDFSDESGKHPLRITRLFFWQALAVSRNVMGHMPDIGELGTKEWGAKLEEEARRYQRK